MVIEMRSAASFLVVIVQKIDERSFADVFNTDENGPHVLLLSKS